jgi:hypothetical protein
MGFLILALALVVQILTLRMDSMVGRVAQPDASVDGVELAVRVRRLQLCSRHDCLDTVSFQSKKSSHNSYQHSMMLRLS